MVHFPLLLAFFPIYFFCILSLHWFLPPFHSIHIIFISLCQLSSQIHSLTFFPLLPCTPLCKCLPSFSYSSSLSSFLLFLFSPVFVNIILCSFFTLFPSLFFSFFTTHFSWRSHILFSFHIWPFLHHTHWPFSCSIRRAHLPLSSASFPLLTPYFSSFVFWAKLGQVFFFCKMQKVC